MSHSIYILECSDKTYYTGYTNNIEKRIETHNLGKWAKYTRGRLPIKLIYTESYATESEARKREYAIKKMKKNEKISLVENFLK